MALPPPRPTTFLWAPGRELGLGPGEGTQVSKRTGYSLRRDEHSLVGAAVVAEGAGWRVEDLSRTTPDGQAIDCAHCHVTVDWFAEKFDHETDSRFPLRGGHENVACASCHIPRPDLDPQGTQRLVHFKPLPVDCRNCHGNAPVSDKGPEEGKS